jgi:hypothetical protein
MVASAGIIVSKTTPAILTHSPVGVAVDTYDFDGNPAKIFLVQMSAFRLAGTSHYAYLTMADGTVVQLLQLGGAGAADGEVITESIVPCLTVPAGTVLTWNHGASFWNLLVLFELKG